jgi:hypothetical protein
MRNLPAALPSGGTRRSWRDAVAVFVLTEIVSAYRVSEGNNPFWSDDLYRMNRRDLARRFDCDPDEVSAALRRLEKWNLVGIHYSTLTDDVGKPCGKIVFTYPRMQNIHRLLAFFAEHKVPIDVKELTSLTNPQGGMNPSSTKDDQTPNEGQSVAEGGNPQNRFQQRQTNGEHRSGGSRRLENASKDKSDERTPAPMDGGDAAKKDMRVDSDSLSETSADEESRSRSVRFCNLWAVAIQRAGYTQICKPSQADQNAALRFFKDYPQIGAFHCAAVAICAWSVGDSKNSATHKWDRFFHCRQSYDIQTFLRNHSANKVLTEIGQYGLQVNTFVNLRWYFTVSELLTFGWKKIPVLAISEDDLWENNPTAMQFYQKRKVPLPSELTQVSQSIYERAKAKT